MIAMPELLFLIVMTALTFLLSLILLFGAGVGLWWIGQCLCDGINDGDWVLDDIITSVGLTVGMSCLAESFIISAVVKVLNDWGITLWL